MLVCSVHAGTSRHTGHDRTLWRQSARFQRDIRELGEGWTETVLLLDYIRKATLCEDVESFGNLQSHVFDLIF